MRPIRVDLMSKVKQPSSFLQSFFKDYIDHSYRASVPDNGVFRNPSPANIPGYERPVTEASKIYKNYYFQRDSRRNYPATRHIINPYLANAAIAAPDQKLIQNKDDNAASVKEAVQAPKPEEKKEETFKPLVPPGRPHKYVDNHEGSPYRVSYNTYFNKK